MARAVLRAWTLISLPMPERSLRSARIEQMTAPEPTPISKTTDPRGARISACSTRISVSGRGMKTCLLTMNLLP